MVHQDLKLCKIPFVICCRGCFLFDIILLMEEVLDREARRDYQNNAIKVFKFGLSVILIYLLAFGFMLFAMQMRSGLEGF